MSINAINWLFLEQVGEDVSHRNLLLCRRWCAQSVTSCNLASKVHVIQKELLSPCVDQVGADIILRLHS